MDGWIEALKGTDQNTGLTVWIWVFKLGSGSWVSVLQGLFGWSILDLDVWFFGSGHCCFADTKM